MTKPIDLRPDHAAIVQEVLARHLPAGVSVRVFGSRAKWTAKTFSDLDLAVKGKEKLPYKVMVELADAFEESDLPFRVDVVDWHAVTPSFQAVIDRDGLAFNDKRIENWCEVALDDVATLNGGFAFKSSQYTESGRFVLRTINITDDFAITKEGATFISEREAANFARFALQEHDTLFVMVAATLGKVGYVRSKDLPALLNQNMWVIRARPNKIEPRFLHYAFREISKIPLSWVSGSARSFLRRDDVRTLRFLLPPMSEQEAIADILAALDDKIELNRRMNETLEGMAQAIFRDWFVDFGPVRRKAAGETDAVAIMGGLTPDPARAAQLAALFPDAFGDDGLPVGWTETAIGDLVKPQGGSTPSTADEALWSPPCHYWATPKDLSNMTDLALFDTARQISDAGLAKITSGLLPPGSVLLSSRAPIGYLAIAQVPVAINQGFIGLVPTTEVGSSYLYCWCKANMDKIVANANGSTFQEISKKNFRPITSALPADRRLIAEFGLVADPMFARLIAAAIETRTLAETRDYLLPRLMSGTVRVARESEAA